MLNNWRLRRQTKQKLKRLERKHASLQAPYPMPDDWPHKEKYESLWAKIVEERLMLRVYQTLSLEDKARRLGIEIPDDKAGWWEGDKGLSPFTATGIIGVRKIIRDERFRRLEQWVKVVIPVISALTGLLGILFGLLTLLWKH